MADIPKYIVKKQQLFNDQLTAAVPHPEIAEEIERGLIFAVRHFPEQGMDTGRSSPYRVFAWPIARTERHPALIAYYCFRETTVLLMSIKVTEDQDD